MHLLLWSLVYGKKEQHVEECQVVLFADTVRIDLIETFD
jgi:hypothetical protein